MSNATLVWTEMQSLRKVYDALPTEIDEFGNPDEIKDLELFDRIERLQDIFRQYTMQERALAVSVDNGDYIADSWAQDEFHKELDRTAHIRLVRQSA